QRPGPGPTVQALEDADRKPPSPPALSKASDAPRATLNDRSQAQPGFAFKGSSYQRRCPSSAVAMCSIALMIFQRPELEALAPHRLRWPLPPTKRVCWEADMAQRLDLSIQSKAPERRDT